MCSLSDIQLLFAHIEMSLYMQYLLSPKAKGAKINMAEVSSCSCYGVLQRYLARLCSLSETCSAFHSKDSRSCRQATYDRSS